jgi:SAM-dependent methyltransferase
MRDVLASINQEVYGRRRVVREYYGLSQLFPAERVILNDLLPEIKAKRLLDIGVGAGRTTGPLLEISRDYAAIDIVPEMVAGTRKRFALESVWCCDARDMSQFADASFDFVLFSFNGIDYLGHKERPRVVNEVARVLGASGIFVFSSHNRNVRDLGKLPWQCDNVKLTLGLVKDSLISLLYLPRHARLKRHEVYEADYAMVNDSAHSYSLLTCYVSIAAQTRDLLRAGFSEVRAYDVQGEVVTKDDSSPWIYYVARKQPAYCVSAVERSTSQVNRELNLRSS